MKLSDFNVGIDSGLSPAIKDFNNPRPLTGGLNDATISNMAAHAASLSTPDSLLSTYSRVTNELKSGASSYTLDEMLKQQNDFDYSANLAALRDVLADPEIPVDQKTVYTQGFMTLASQPLGSRSLNVLVGRQAQLADSEEDDNDETEFTRLEGAGELDEVDEYNGWVQKQINANNNLSTQDGINKVVDILELMVPFMEGAAVAKTTTAINEGLSGKTGALLQSLAVLGESKESVRVALASMPPEARKELAQKVVNYVRSGNGSITGRPNETIVLNQLNSFLVNGEYGGDDRFLDNLFSVLDLGVFLSPLFKAGKAASAASTARRAKLAEESLAAAESEITEVVESVIPPSRQLTYDPPSPTVFVNPRGDASTIMDDVVIGEETINTAVDMMADRIIGKFNKPSLKTPSSPDMAQMVDDVGADLDIASIREDVRKSISEVYTATTYADEDIVKKVTKAAGDTLRKRMVETPRTFSATTSQLIRQAVVESNARRRMVRSTVSPTSLSQTLKNTNPGKARAAFRTVVADQSGQMAETVYGTSRTEAIANDVLPEVSEMTGTVRNKIEMDEVGPNPDMDAVNQLRASRGDIHFSPAEKQQMRNTAISDFRDVVGLVPRRAMATVGDGPVSNVIETDSGVIFDMVYGPKNGGFRSPKQAIDQAVFALRKYGVTSNEVELLAKQTNGDWAPFNMKTSVKDGNYLVRVKHQYEFSPADTINWTLTSTNKFWRMFDVVTGSGKSGGLAQHFIPSSAVVDPKLINSASVASDRTAWLNKKLIELGGDYAQSFGKLDKRQKELVSSYIIEANNKGLPFNPVNLRSRGFSEPAIDTVRQWKRVNDTLYYFENQDLNKTLRARGYWYFTDQSSNTSLVVKPISNRGMIDGVKAYDSTAGKVVELTKGNIEELYRKGGTLARTRGPVEIPGSTFDMVIVKNSSEGSYIRRIRDNDNTLNYRHGHYTVRYTDPYFITKEMVNDGKVYHKAVATSGSLKDAEQLLARLKATDEQGVYGVRGDLKRGSASYEEAEWSSMVSAGRTSQRIRGERLTNFTGQQTDPNHIHIESPEESLVRSIGSMAARVAHRDVVDAAKLRFMNQFRDILPKTDGLEQWPEDVRLIGKGDPTIDPSRIKDARNTWRYIEAIDSGYVNLLDDASKWIFKSMSETAGRKGWNWLETGLYQASRASPTAYARKKAFRLLLAANPLRQVLVQSMQALPVVMATNPRMALTGRLPAQFILLNYLNRGGDVDSFFKAIAKNATGLTVEEAKKMAKDYELSGFEAAVKANSLIRDDLKRLVDRNVFSKVGSFAAKPLNFTQKIGFEAGENMLMRTVWLSEYDNLARIKPIKDIGPADIEELNARVRNLTLNMNKAGELPYNENMFSVALQFFQAPHKAFSQIVFGHTGLSGMDRLKLGTAYVLTYGIGGNFLLDIALKAVQMPQEVKELIEGGLFNLMLNSALSSLYGEETGIDFSDSLRLFEVPDLFKFFNQIISMEFGEALANSPSAGLILGNNPRITDFVKQMARPFTVDNESKPDELLKTGKAFLNVFSGMSNFFKAKYAAEYKQLISTTGKVTDFHVNELEALAKAAGFATIDEIDQYLFDEKSYRATQKYKEDITKLINETSKYLAMEGIANNEAEYYLRMLSEAQRVYKNDPFYLKEFQSQLYYKASRGEYEIFDTILRLAGYMNEEDLRAMIATAPIKNEQDRERLYSIVEQMKGSR